MKMINVKSSNVKAIGYDPNMKVLRVEFVHGPSAYEYSGVPLEVFQGFRDASSPGKYFLAEVKDRFDFRKV
jgi:lysyl-tRNA synthetase class 2